MATFVSDTFTESGDTALGSHSGETGAVWTRVVGTGNWTVDAATDRAYCPLASGYSASGVPATADYYVDAHVYAGTLSNATTGQVGVTVRNQGSGNCYWLVIRHPANVIEIRKGTGGTSSVLASNPLTLSTTTTYLIRLEVAGTTLTASVDGSQVMQVTDSSYTPAGFAGVRSDTANDVVRDVSLVDFSATDGAGGPTVPAVTGISPTHGPTIGGTSVVITGTVFAAVNAVSFGGAPADSFTVDSSTQITAIAPAGVASSVVDVVVANAVGSSGTSSADHYTYDPTPSNFQMGQLRIRQP